MSKSMLRAAVVVSIAALLFLVLGRRGGRADAAGPSPIARAMPSGAVAYLESDDLRGALALWKDSPLRTEWSRSQAAMRMGRSMLYLRLSERLAALERIAGVSLTIDELAAVVGKRAGIAVYDLSDTVFVLQAQLESAELARHPLSLARKRFDTRRHAGIEYFIATDDETRAELAFTFVGARLLVSNSVARLGDAMVLAAREEKVKTDGKPGKSLADDAGYTALAAAGAATAHVRVWVNLAALRGTHQFDDFWIFGGDSKKLEGIDGALLTLFAQKGKQGELVETRTYAYGDPSLRPGAAKGEIAWPGVGLLEEVRATNAAGAGARIARLLPSIALTDVDGRIERGTPPDVTGRLAAALADAAPTRAYEAVVVEPVKGRLAPRQARGGVIALRLAAPDKLDRKLLEAAIVDHVRWIASDGAPVPMAFAGDTLRIPLVDDVTPTLLVDGAVLIVATSPDLARKGAAAAGLLAEDTPVGSRLDVTATAARWGAIAKVIGARADWLDSASGDLAVEILPGLLDASGAKSVHTTGWVEGAHYVEQVRYR